MDIKNKKNELLKTFGTSELAISCVNEILKIIDIYPRNQMTITEIEQLDEWLECKKLLNNEKQDN